MADEKLKIQPDAKEVGQPQSDKTDAATDEFVLPTQEQLGEMDAEQLRAIYPKMVDKYVDGKKMQTASHYQNAEIARRKEELDSYEERLRQQERELYDRRQKSLDEQFSVMNQPTPQPQPTAPPDPNTDPYGYAEYWKKQAELEKTKNDKQFEDIRKEIADTKTATAAIRMENWIDKNISSKEEFNLVDPLEIELYFRKNPQASTDFPDIMRVATKIQAQKKAMIDAQVEKQVNDTLAQKAEAAKNAQIEPGGQYGGQKQVDWDKLSDSEEDREIENLVRGIKARKKGG